jgi:hypothetical protein
VWIYSTLVVQMHPLLTRTVVGRKYSGLSAGMLTRATSGRVGWRRGQRCPTTASCGVVYSA